MEACTRASRASQVEFRGDDRFLANGDDSGSARYNSINPTVGIVYRPSQSSSIYASYGRGFETPTLNELAYRPDGSAGFQHRTRAGAQQQLRDRRESGVRRRSLRGTVAFLRSILKTTSSSAPMPEAARRLPMRRPHAGAASRRASDGSRTGVVIYASLAAIRAEFAEPFFTCTAAPCTQPTVLVPAGNRLPGVPAYTSYLETEYRVHETDIALDMRAQSKICRGRPRYRRMAPGYALFNLALARTFLVGPAKLRAFLRIDNLLNARYIGSVIVNEANGRFFEPAPGRSWLLGLDARL